MGCRRKRVAELAIVVGIAVGLAVPGTASAAGWLGTWGSAASRGTGASSGYPATGFTDQTIRQAVQTSAGGAQVRVRLSNLYGTKAVTFANVSVARATTSHQPQAGTLARLRFGGGSSVTLQPGTQRVSDALTFSAPSQSELVVSMYVSGSSGPATFHNVSKERVSVGGGDQTQTTTALTDTANSFFLTGVDTYRTEANLGTVVAFGNSITDGVLKRAGETYAYRSVEPYSDRLGRRILSNGAGKVRGIVNAGLAGAQLLGAGGPTLPSTFDRLGPDVFERPSVKTMIVLLGANDIILHDAQSSSPRSAADLLGGMRDVVARAHQQGITVIGSTITPMRNGVGSANGRETVRTQFNDSVRGASPFDCLVDLDAVLRDPSLPYRMQATYDSGDGLHPSAAGYRAMGEAVPTGCIG